jgi:hypothetical protein
MRIKGLKDEDFINYKKPSMFIIFPYCSFKCDKENGCSLCQNSKLALEPVYEVSYRDILNRYISNPITEAIVCGGLEPFDTPNELLGLIRAARDDFGIEDDIVIYTGYTEEEIEEEWLYDFLAKYKNIIIKFGRFRPNETPHLDEVLGIKLVSNNQYAKRIE